MKRILIASILMSAAAATPAAAHAPLLDCWTEGDNIMCEAGYTDGSSAANQVIRVRDEEDRLVFEDHFGEDGSFSFARPEADEFNVQFEGDSAHVVVLYSSDFE